MKIMKVNKPEKKPQSSGYMFPSYHWPSALNAARGGIGIPAQASEDP